MQVYKKIYKALQRVTGPVNRRAALAHVGVFGLGRGRPRRIGRALVSYLSDYVRFVTTQASPAVWNNGDLGTTLERLCQGTFAGHSHHWESSEVVRQLIERGFVVDCLYDRAGYLLTDVSGYDLILDEWSNMPGWAEQNPKAKKLFYATTSHWLQCNRAELQRLGWLFRRRGVVVVPFWQLPPLLGPAKADLVSYFGSDYTAEHYGVLRPKLRHLSVTTCVFGLDAAPGKVWESAKRRFLLFGSRGWVHRGVDLVIEAFMQADFELIICGGDSGFLDVYGHMLKQKPNIHYMGFVYPDSEEFREIVKKVCAVVYPSAAEGCSTSVLQCMQFGLIPLVTRAAGLSIHDFWPPLNGATDRELIEDILKRCTDLSQRPDHELAELSRRFWEFANQHHTRQAFRTSLNAVLDELLG